MKEERGAHSHLLVTTIADAIVPGWPTVVLALVEFTGIFLPTSVYKDVKSKHLLLVPVHAGGVAGALPGMQYRLKSIQMPSVSGTAELVSDDEPPTPCLHVLPQQSLLPLQRLLPAFFLVRKT
jgi:hypothetical protein